MSLSTTVVAEEAKGCCLRSLKTMASKQSHSHIIFLTGLLMGRDGRPVLNGRLQDETFQTLVARMRTLGWECSALQFKLLVENESFDATASDDKEVESAKRRFANIMLAQDDGVSQDVCWIYVTATADKTN